MILHVIMDRSEVEAVVNSKEEAPEKMRVILKAAYDVMPQMLQEARKSQHVFYFHAAVNLIEPPLDEGEVPKPFYELPEDLFEGLSDEDNSGATPN